VKIVISLSFAVLLGLGLSGCSNGRNSNSLTSADLDEVRTTASKAHAATAQIETHHKMRDSWTIFHP
jgi:outer membrane murein-binding lipoprotein Lpp